MHINLYFKSIQSLISWSDTSHTLVYHRCWWRLASLFVGKEHYHGENSSGSKGQTDKAKACFKLCPHLHNNSPQTCNTNPWMPVTRKIKFPLILVQFTNLSMLLESTVCADIRDPVPMPSQAGETESQPGNGETLFSQWIIPFSL